MEISKDQLIAAEAKLSSRELGAYRAYVGLGQPRLSPDTQARFFALYLKGETLEEIVRLNRGFSLGQLAQARIEGDWDVRRDEYLQELFAGARSVVQQATMESIRFIADQLSAVHKRFGEAARRYIQTGDDKDYKAFGIDDIRSYKTAVEALQKITGQDKKVVEHHHDRHEGPVVDVNRPLKPEEAANVVRLAAIKGGKK